MHIFAETVKVSPPWVSEYTHNFTTPEEYKTKILSKTIVDTVGNTETAFATHHTLERTPRTTFNTQSLLRTHGREVDVAKQELKTTCERLFPSVEAIEAAMYRYHQTSNGLITSHGFAEICNKAGATISREEFLALERSSRKDRFGRLKCEDIIELIRIHGPVE